MRNYSVVCHNERRMISGELLDANSAGCDVISRDRSLTPVFQLRSSVILNILDIKKRIFVNVIARAIEAKRENDCWVYSFSWSRKPAHLSLEPDSNY